MLQRIYSTEASRMQNLELCSIQFYAQRNKNTEEPFILTQATKKITGKKQRVLVIETIAV
jgi:hypothetical protein